MARAAVPDVPASDPQYRDRLLADIKTDEDVDALWQRLYSVDPESAKIIHKNNVKRVIRALEIYDATGKPKTYFDELTKNAEPPIKIGMITLDVHNRDMLYERIDRRVDIMLAEGLEAEARSLYERGIITADNTAGQAIDYKELIGYFEGRATLDEAIAELKLASRRYAKRQLTWFRRSNAYRLYLDTADGEMRQESEILAELFIAAKNFLNTI